MGPISLESQEKDKDGSQDSKLLKEDRVDIHNLES